MRYSWLTAIALVSTGAQTRIAASGKPDAMDVMRPMHPKVLLFARTDLVCQ